MAQRLSDTSAQPALTRFDILPKPLKALVVILYALGIGLFVWYIFGWTVRGFVLEDVRYYYMLYAVFITCAFLTMPANKKKDKLRLPWYDLVLAALALGTLVYPVFRARSIMIMAWTPPPSTLDLAVGCIIALLALETSRRMAGIPFVLISLVAVTYPLYAQNLSGLLWGMGMSFPEIIGSFAFSREGVLGLPAQVMGEILIGFLIFAGMLMASGAARVFLNLALVLMGRFRGGPAKVAVLASGFFGSLSGSPVANAASTGAVTIPAMKRMGYPAHYAGAIESVASQGGPVMPPVMGTTIFIMAIITGIPYAVIMVAAIIPALLYYYGLLIQVDAYAARTGLRGLPREEIPSMREVLKDGWPLILVLVFLVFGLVYMRWGAVSALYASGLIVLLSYTKRENWMTPKRLIASLVSMGNLITYVMSVLVAVGFILIGISTTGSLTSITAQVVAAGATNLPLILAITCLICYLFGMVGVSMIAYIVLAVTAIPALVTMTGLPVLALHLFVMYYIITTGITPPICITAFAAAAIAQAPPFKTAFTAMRLAIVLYFIPFFFLFNPALILDGPITETLILFALALVGIAILAAGLEGYLLKVGRLDLWSRPILTAGGFLIAFPGWTTTIIGAAMTAAVIVVILMKRRVLEKSAA